MKIADSTIQLSSSHTTIEHHQREESLVAWQKGENLQTMEGKEEKGKNLKALALSFQESAAKVSISQAARRKAPVTQKAEKLTGQDRAMANLNMRILKAMFERTTGEKFNIFDPEQLQDKLEAIESSRNSLQQPVEPGREAEQQPIQAAEQGWGVAYDFYESHYEYEATSFQAHGVVQTEDGREIDFSVELSMTREFMSEQQISLRAGDALKDPLVVNFEATAAELTQDRFSFDIDIDGTDDQISFVGPNSGFLSLDRNGDNIVNDGSELFGARTGNGFSELAAFDQDNNGWIDENDSVYDRLRIWTKTAAGEDQLLALGQKGVGAIYLGHISTPFNLKDSDNTLQGQIQSSGVFLHEDGRVGTIQQLDLVA